MKIITTDTLMKFALTSGFTEEELYTDTRILEFVKSIISTTDNWKLRLPRKDDTMSVDEYYEFINQIKINCMEDMDHVQGYDIIKCEGKNNIILLYTEYFNSIALNWGTGYGMNLQCTEEEMKELRDKLISAFPL